MIAYRFGGNGRKGSKGGGGAVAKSRKRVRKLNREEKRL